MASGSPRGAPSASRRCRHRSIAPPNGVARTARAEDCRQVFGKLEVQLVSCEDSVIGLCAEAEIRGSRPIRSSYRFAPQVASPVPGSTDPNLFSLVADIELETRQGILTAEKVGLFNQLTGETVATYDIRTGVYTGKLVASGFFDLSAGRGRGLIWGHVCRSE